MKSHICNTCTNSKANSQKRYKQKGSLLVEYGIVVILIAILAMGAIFKGDVLFGSSGVKNLVDSGRSLALAAHAEKRQTGSYGSASLTNWLVDSGAVPKDLRISGTSPNQVINHTLDDGGTLGVTGRVTKVVVTIDSLTKKTCLEVFKNASGFERVTVDAAAPSAISITTGGATPPFSSAAASAQCAAATGNKVHMIMR